MKSLGKNWEAYMEKSVSERFIVRRIQDKALGHVEGSGDLFMFTLEGGHCHAVIAVGVEAGKRWATVYLIETQKEYRNRGECQKLLIALKKLFEKLNANFAVWCPMNDTMEYICKKLSIKTY